MGDEEAELQGCVKLEMPALDSQARGPRPVPGSQRARTTSTSSEKSKACARDCFPGELRNSLAPSSPLRPRDRSRSSRLTSRANSHEEVDVHCDLALSIPSRPWRPLCEIASAHLRPSSRTATRPWVAACPHAQGVYRKTQSLRTRLFPWGTSKLSRAIVAAATEGPVAVPIFHSEDRATSRHAACPQAKDTCTQPEISAQRKHASAVAVGLLRRSGVSLGALGPWDRSRSGTLTLRAGPSRAPGTGQ